jgi:hypothetical protein
MVKLPVHVPLTRIVDPDGALLIAFWRSVPVWGGQLTDVTADAVAEMATAAAKANTLAARPVPARRIHEFFPTDVPL